MKSFSEIVRKWGRENLAADLQVPKERVRAWERFDTIPDEYWKEMLATAPQRNIRISPNLLIDLAARD
jgi:DNA-binding transcriptional regulator YiaG